MVILTHATVWERHAGLMLRSTWRRHANDIEAPPVDRGETSRRTSVSGVRRRRKLTRTADSLLTAGFVDLILLFLYGYTGGISCLSSAPLEWRWSWWPPGWACRDPFTGAGSPGAVSWTLLVVSFVVWSELAVLALSRRAFGRDSSDCRSDTADGGSPFSIDER